MKLWPSARRESREGFEPSRTPRKMIDPPSNQGAFTISDAKASPGKKQFRAFMQMCLSMPLNSKCFFRRGILSPTSAISAAKCPKSYH